MSQKKALAFLTKAGLCPTSKSMSFVCWKCKKDMQKNGSVFRCQNRSCSQRPHLTAARVAFTPLFGFASNGTDIDYAMLLRTCLTVGAKLSNDSAIQMLRMPGQSLSSVEHKVDDFYTKIKIALAYAETKYNRSVQFKDEIVEPDSGRMGCQDSIAENSSGPDTGLERKIHQAVDRQSIAEHCVQAWQRHGSRIQG